MERALSYTTPELVEAAIRLVAEAFSQKEVMCKNLVWPGHNSVDLFTNSARGFLSGLRGYEISIAILDTESHVVGVFISEVMSRYVPHTSSPSMADGSGTHATTHLSFSRHIITTCDRSSPPAVLFILDSV